MAPQLREEDELAAELAAVAEAFLVGRYVRLVNLVSRTELNGRFGRVCGRTASEQRCCTHCARAQHAAERQRASQVAMRTSSHCAPNGRRRQRSISTTATV